jgi:hypothetical protein
MLLNLSHLPLKKKKWWHVHVGSLLKEHKGVEVTSSKSDEFFLICFFSKKKIKLYKNLHGIVLSNLQI